MEPSREDASGAQLEYKDVHAVSNLQYQIWKLPIQVLSEENQIVEPAASKLVSLLHIYQLFYFNLTCNPAKGIPASLPLRNEKYHDYTEKHSIPVVYKKYFLNFPGHLSEYSQIPFIPNIYANEKNSSDF